MVKRSDDKSSGATLLAHGGVGPEHRSVGGLGESGSGDGRSENKKKRILGTGLDSAHNALLSSIKESSAVIVISVQRSRRRDHEAAAGAGWKGQDRHLADRGRINGCVGRYGFICAEQGCTVFAAAVSQQLWSRRRYSHRFGLKITSRGEPHAFDVADEDHAVRTVFAKGGGALHI